MEVIRCWTAAQVDQALSERPEFFEHQLLGFDAEVCIGTIVDCRS
jgi:hypothetical protein